MSQFILCEPRNTCSNVACYQTTENKITTSETLLGGEEAKKTTESSRQWEYTKLREVKAMHVYMDEQVRDTSDVRVVHSEEVNVLKFRVYVWRVLHL